MFQLLWVSVFFYELTEVLSCFLIGRVCSEADTHPDSTICISAALTESIPNIPDVDILRDMIIPALLQTVVKGFNLDYCTMCSVIFLGHVYSCYYAIASFFIPWITWREFVRRVWRECRLGHFSWCCLKIGIEIVINLKKHLGM